MYSIESVTLQSGRLQFSRRSEMPFERLRFLTGFQETDELTLLAAGTTTVAAQRGGFQALQSIGRGVVNRVQAFVNDDERSATHYSPMPRWAGITVQTNSGALTSYGVELGVELGGLTVEHIDLPGVGLGERKVRLIQSDASEIN